MNIKHLSHKHVSRVLVAVLVGLIAVPTVMTGWFGAVQDDRNLMQIIQQTAVSDAGRVRYIRRNYWRAVDVYNELVSIGREGLIPPDINNIASIEYYLDPENYAEEQENVHASAPDAPEGETEYLRAISDAQHTYNMLPEFLRDRLDGYINTRFCAPTLSTYRVRSSEDLNLYTLCVRLLDERIADLAPRVLQRGTYLRGYYPVGFSQARSLKHRLENLQQSLLHDDGTSVRPSTYEEYRPRVDRVE